MNSNVTVACFGATGFFLPLNRARLVISPCFLSLCYRPQAWCWSELLSGGPCLHKLGFQNRAKGWYEVKSCEGSGDWWASTAEKLRKNLLSSACRVPEARNVSCGKTFFNRGRRTGIDFLIYLSARKQESSKCFPNMLNYSFKILLRLYLQRSSITWPKFVTVIKKKKPRATIFFKRQFSSHSSTSILRSHDTCSQGGIITLPVSISRSITGRTSVITEHY